jgi:sec-independent protein translocase protein TatA
VSVIPSIGPMEILLVAIVALVVLGPKKLPEAGRSLGHGIRELKSSLSDPPRRSAPGDPDGT